MTTDLLNSENDRVNEYISTMSALGFQSYISKATKEMMVSSSCLDYLSVKTNRNLKNKYVILPTVLQTSETDHYSIILQFIN